MPNVDNAFGFTAPIQSIDLTGASVSLATDLDDKKKQVVLELTLWGPNNFLYNVRPRLLISNEVCNAIRAKETPTGANDLIEFFDVSTDDDEAIATAFDQVLGAYIQATVTGQSGNNAILQKLAQLGLIPAGALVPAP